jgi:hypothetical protein
VPVPDTGWSGPAAEGRPDRGRLGGCGELWLTLVTDIDIGTGQALIDSMTNEVTVRDHSIGELIPIQPMSYDDAVRAALRERREARQARS